MVVDTVAHPGDMEMPAGGQQGFEEKVAVIFSSRAIAGANIVGHEVKIKRISWPWVVAIIHTKEADHLKRDRSHRHEGCEGDGTG